MQSPRKGAPGRRELRETLAYTFPACILVLLTLYIPFAMSGFYALTEWNGISKAPLFIGLENFRRIFAGSPSFLNALVFTGKYALLFIVLSNVLGLAFAVALTQRFRAANFLRSMFFLPYIMSMTIVGFIWKFIFSQGFAKLEELTGWGIWGWSWLGDGNLAFWSIGLVGVWQSLGFYIVLYIAGLKALPLDVMEAASIDGASAAQRFFRVVLPLIEPSVTTCVFMSLTNSLKVFDIILALTKGGPGGSTYSATLEIYREAFQNNQYGLGSAKALLFFVIVFLLTQMTLKLFERREVRS
jgi:raffinose/stachyose/melibiose transport system permease protein